MRVYYLRFKIWLRNKRGDKPDISEDAKVRKIVIHGHKIYCWKDSFDISVFGSTGGETLYTFDSLQTQNKFLIDRFGLYQ